ncbi:ComF family protein [Actinomycetota bacterium]
MTLAALADLADLVLPGRCALCPEPVAPLCHRCRDEVADACFPGGAREVAPSPVPRGMPRCVALGAYAGPLGQLLAAYKDDGRRDLAPLLSGLLALSVARAVALVPASAPVLLVPVPTSRAARRRRGDAPLLALARGAAARAGPVRVADALSLRRRVADQAGLGAAARAANLEWAMQTRPRWRAAVCETHILVVDDVLTSGATLVEASRALARSGAASVTAATIAATARRRPVARADGAG